jgi:Bacterial virulence factor lipase N-terminal
MYRQLLVTTALVVLFLWSALARAAGVQARFSLDAPSAGPFPSNLFTVPDPQQHTGLRVHMPLPNCAERPSDCTTLAEINTLDGFNVQPRLSIPFSGPIDVASVSSTTVFLVSLGSPLAGGDPGGTVVGINQIVWDPETNTLHAESDALLAQHTPYALIVTQGIRDTTGRPVEASEAFARFRHDRTWGHSKDPALQAYRRALLQGLAAARGAGVHPADMVVASVFTTQSITAVLEQIRDQIQTATPAPAEFRLGPDGSRTVFALSIVRNNYAASCAGCGAPNFASSFVFVYVHCIGFG